MSSVTEFAVGYFSMLLGLMGLCFWLFSIIHDYTYKTELLGAPMWCINLLIWPVGVGRGIILSLR